MAWVPKLPPASYPSVAEIVAKGVAEVVAERVFLVFFGFALFVLVYFFCLVSFALFVLAYFFCFDSFVLFVLVYFFCLVGWLTVFLLPLCYAGVRSVRRELWDPSHAASGRRRSPGEVEMFEGGVASPSFSTSASE